jgi:hypothetical protein
MNAKTNLEAWLPSRRVTERLRRAPYCSDYRATRLTLYHTGALPADVSKRPWSIADLKPAGRDVAKDSFKVVAVPLMKSLPKRGHLHGECRTARGWSVIEAGRPGDIAPTSLRGRVAGMCQLRLSRSHALLDGDDVCFKTPPGARPRNATRNATYRHPLLSRALPSSPADFCGCMPKVTGARISAAARHGRAAEKACYADL